jgi:toxin-antitoxin system PIN domain toxin
MLYASDSASPVHEKAQAFLTQACSGRDLFYLSWPTVMSYLRIATHSAIFKAPLAPREALGNIEALVAQPRVRLLAEADGFLDVYRTVTGDFPVRGNLVPDAHVASLLQQHGVRTLYTRDADFRKFPFLDVRDPFAA